MSEDTINIEVRKVVNQPTCETCKHIKWENSIATCPLTMIEIPVQDGIDYTTFGCLLHTEKI